MGFTTLSTHLSSLGGVISWAETTMDSSIASSAGTLIAAGDQGCLAAVQATRVEDRNSFDSTPSSLC